MATTAREVVEMLAEDAHYNVGRHLTPHQVQAVIEYVSGLETALRNAGVTAEANAPQSRVLQLLAAGCTDALTDPRQYREPPGDYARRLRQAGAARAASTKEIPDGDLALP